MSEHVEISDADGVRTIVLARPEKKNALTQAMYAAMADAVDSAQIDPAIGVVLLTGAGDAFTAGNDIGDFLAAPPSPDDATPAPVIRFLHTILEAEKPLAAAVNGLAVGVGVTLLLHCDLVTAASAARFKTPFTDLGLVPEAGASLLLPRRIGRARASEMLLLGETLNAEEALACGLVARVVDPAHLLEDARRRCAALARKAPAAVRATKRLLRGDTAEVRERMAEEIRIFAERLQSDEFREAAAAFLEKREPDFAGQN